ncbi:leishmanolysin [Deinococcus misasensis]|uniref:leishmanolysin n=1 Tax=Deinococcus misasensis TaxID=392413 RepID=UPI001FE13D3E|nr:leishmanolysin [Deinococcus misasensis]
MVWSTLVLASLTSCGSPAASTPPFTREPFNITLVFSENSLLNSQQKALFQAAARRWETVIEQGLPDIAGSPPIDDLQITISSVNIDGPGKVMAQSGPLLLRQNKGLPITGMIRFDHHDLQIRELDGTLQNVILHEMGHVLGIGTLWNDHLEYDNQGGCLNSNQISFTGEHATRYFHELGKTGGVPVENQYGAGTKCGHWDEETFKSELMTGFSTSNPMPLSKLTLGALQDLGYEVNLQAADPYTLPQSEVSGQRAGFELLEILTVPRVLKPGETPSSIDP